MDLKILYKNLLGDLDMEGNDWVEITNVEHPISIIDSGEIVTCLLFYVRERNTLKEHLDYKKIRNYAILSISDEKPNKRYLEMYGMYLPIEDEKEVYEISAAIKEFYKFI
jgi:hypothetical protein